jgi:hypothetical protein
VRDRIQSDTDIVIDTEGLVTYAGIHTRRPAAVADVLLQKPQMQLALYMDGERVIVRDSRGSAAIEKKGGKIRYVAIDRDVLNYQPVVTLLTRSGKADAEGFASSDDWFIATVDHEWPNAPPPDMGCLSRHCRLPVRPDDNPQGWIHERVSPL